LQGCATERERERERERKKEGGSDKEGGRERVRKSGRERYVENGYGIYFIGFNNDRICYFYF
jgi:hypothetical protein